MISDQVGERKWAATLECTGTAYLEAHFMVTCIKNPDSYS